MSSLCALVRSFLLLLILVSAVSADTPAGAEKRPLTVEDLWNVRRVGPPSVSPDGKWAVVELTTFDMEKDDSSSNLWLLSTNGNQQKQLTNTSGKNSGPKWSPDGQWIAFTGKRGNDEVAQVYVIAPQGGEARRV